MAWMLQGSTRARAQQARAASDEAGGIAPPPTSDPAIWVDAAEPARSTFIGENGTMAGIYGVGGDPVQQFQKGAVQIDVREGFLFEGRPLALASVIEKSAGSFRLYAIDPHSRQMNPFQTARRRALQGVTASCFYRSPETQSLYLFALSQKGIAHQLQLVERNSRLRARRVRSFPLPFGAAACAADDELGTVYIAAGNSLYKYDAEPDTQAAVLTRVTSNTNTSIQGFTIYRASDQTGYLLASLGSNEILAFQREGEHQLVNTLNLGDDQNLRIAGIDVVNTPLGEELPLGAVLAQDGNRLRVYPWDQLANSVYPPLTIDPASPAPLNDDIEPSPSEEPPKTGALNPSKSEPAPSEPHALAAGNPEEPNFFTMSEAVGGELSFSTDGLQESVAEYNGLLSLEKSIFGLGSLSYDSAIDGMHPASSGAFRPNSGFGLGWRFHLGRLIVEELNGGPQGIAFPYVFEYGDGSRARWACQDTTCTSGLLSDFSRVESLSGGGFRVTTTSGTIYTLNYRVRGDKSSADVPWPWAGGAEGWYATRIADAFGNFTKIEYYGSTSTNEFHHSPVPRVITTGRQTSTGEQPTSRLCFYLEGNGATNQIPLDRWDVATSRFRIGKIRAPGPEGALTSMSSGWLTYSLSYDVVQQAVSGFQEVAQLTGIELEGSFEKYGFSYYGLAEDPGYGRLKGITYPSGGTATYDYGFYFMVVGGWNQYDDIHGDNSYNQKGAVKQRTVWDPAASNSTVWSFQYGFGTFGVSDGPEQMLQYNIVQRAANGQDPGTRTESWYEPMHDVNHPASAKTGRLRHRRVYPSVNAATAVREEHRYTAVFHLGPLKHDGRPIFVALPGARDVVVTDGTNQAHYVESYRDHTLNGADNAFVLSRMSVNGGKDYDSYGNQPFAERRQATAVTFNYESARCDSRWEFFGDQPPCDQDTVTISGGEASTYQKNIFKYVVDTDPRSSQYLAANQVQLVSRREIRDIDDQLLSADETYYDNDPRKPLEGVSSGIGDRTQAILGRASVHIQVNTEDSGKSTFLSRVYAPVGSTTELPGALLEEALKVDAGIYRRHRNSYIKGSSCVPPQSPTLTTFVKSNGLQVVLSKTEYNCMGAPRWIEDENRRRTSFRYDAQGRIEKEIQPGDSDAKPTTEYVYDDSGASSSTWKPRRMEVRTLSDDVSYHATHSFYDGLGRVFHNQKLQSNGNGDGKVIARSTRYFGAPEQTRPYIHNATADPAVYAAPVFTGPRVVTVQDGLGRTLEVQDKNGNNVVRKVTHLYGDTQASLSLLDSAVIDANGHRTVTTHDAWGRKTKVTLPDGNESIFEYDALGRLEKTIHPDKRESSQSYDGLGRLRSQTSPGAGTENFEYDLSGAVVRHKSNGTIFRQYDERGRLESEELEWSEATRFPMALYIYDTHPLDSGIANRYNGKGRLTQVQFGNKRLTSSYSYGYDDKGRIVEQITKHFDLDAKKTETFYDRQGLLRRTLYQSGASDELQLEYTYDRNMRLKQILDANSTSPCGSGDRVLFSNSYDIDGKPWREEWLPCPGSRLQGVDYRRDSFGRLVSINDPTLSQSVDPGGDNNDIFGLKLGYEEKFLGSTPQNNGNISWASWKTAGLSQATYLFTYDERDRLRVADFRERSQTGSWNDPSKFDVEYDYDDMGNFRTVSRHDHRGILSDVSYILDPANGRQLSRLGGAMSASFRYDAMGNMSYNGRWGAGNTLVYDHRNLLTTATIPQRSRLAFHYDHLGARVRKGILPYDADEENFIPGDVFHYLPQAVYKNNKILFWDIDGRARLVPQGSDFGKAGLAFFMKDHLKSVRATLHEDGSLLENTDYYPFGKEMPQRSQRAATRELQQYTGHLRDREFPTTIDYFEARYYDPELGRFMSVDAAKDLFPSVSPYVYALDNPMRFVDPDGNMPTDDPEDRARRRREQRNAIVTTAAKAGVAIGSVVETLSISFKQKLGKFFSAGAEWEPFKKSGNVNASTPGGNVSFGTEGFNYDPGLNVVVDSNSPGRDGTKVNVSLNKNGAGVTVDGYGAIISGDRVSVTGAGYGLSVGENSGSISVPRFGLGYGDASAWLKIYGVKLSVDGAEAAENARPIFNAINYFSPPPSTSAPDVEALRQRALFPFGQN